MQRAPFILAWLGISPLLAAFASLSAPGEEAEARKAEGLLPTHVVVERATDKITIDGTLDEESWQNAQRLLVDVVHPKGVSTRPAGSCRMTWDDENYYISFDVPDDDIQAQGEGHDDCDIVPPRDVVEVFIDINNDSEHFFELHLNPLNGFNDIFIIRPREESPLHARTRWGLVFIGGWDLPEHETAVQVDGTVNDNSDKDKRWTAEIRLPFKSLMMPMGQERPAQGDTWRVQLVVQDGDAEHRYMAWSPSYEPWFHHGIETWGRVEFGE